jgi:uroporphyrinogen decarboxylase
MNMSYQPTVPLDKLPSHFISHDTESHKKWHTGSVTRFASPFVDVFKDRIDFDPIVMAHACTLLGFTNRDFYESPEIAVQCVAYFNELFDLLPVAHFFYSNVFLEMYGVKLQTTNTLPWIAVGDRVVKNPEDADKIPKFEKEDLKPEKCKTTELHWRAFDYEKAHMPDMMLPMHNVFCLFSMAAELVGPEKFIIWTRKEPKACHKILDALAYTSSSGAGLTADKYGFNMNVIGSVLANSTVLPPKYVKEFSFDHQRDFVRRCLALGGGPQLWYHLCGDHSRDYSMWKNVLTTPFTVIHIGYYGDDVFPGDLLKKEFGNRMTLLATVDGKRMIEPNFSWIYEQSKSQLLKARDAPRGCILGTTCETPLITNPGCTLAAVKACKDYGTYGTW